LPKSGKTPRIRAILALLYLPANVKMLMEIQKIVGGKVVKEFKEQKEYIVWYAVNKKDLKSFFTLVEKYPFLTTRKQLQYTFAKQCMINFNAANFLSDRSNKYLVPNNL
jgi:hypothetical protein